GTWISTAYLIGEIIVIPMTDFMSRVFSLRRYLLANVALFLLFSALCGQAHSLGEMIVFRALQGFSGGVMIPLGFTIILSMLPPSKHAAGLAGFAVTATFAPAIGPTIGGYFTDNYGWSYAFYVKLVPGVVMLGMLWYGLPKAPMQLGLLRRGDWRGIALMAVGLAAFQTVLDDGNVYDWFGSPFIVKLSLVAAVALVAFVVLEFITPEPLVNFRLLGRRNFGLGTFGNFLLGFALLASAFLLPQYLAVTQGFDAEQSGEVVAWIGLPQLLVIPLVPLLMKRIEDCASGGRRRLGPLQHDAQPRRDDRHRRDRDVLYKARAVSLGDHQYACVAARTGDPQPARRSAAILHVAWVPRPRRGAAPRRHRRRRHHPRAGDDHGLRRLLCLARRPPHCHDSPSRVAEEGHCLGQRGALGAPRASLSFQKKTGQPVRL